MLELGDTNLQSFLSQVEGNFSGQVAISFGIIAMALVIACGLIMTAKLSDEESVLFGLGSGEEQEGANAVGTTFKTFDGQDDYIKETLGAEYYVEEFEKIAESEEVTKAVDEVKKAIDEAKNEHKILKIFAEGADAPLP